MARFVFRLQALLDQRLHIEREKQRAVASFERQRVDIERAIAGRQSIIRGCKDDLRALLAASPGGADMRDVRLQAGASLSAQAHTQRLALQLAGVYQRLEGARRELRAATARRRAVELLKQRRFEAWRREQNRIETAELDEIATQRALVTGF